MANINGTNKSDILIGTAEADLIRGLAGFDSINGSGGDDRLEGGAGPDLLNGGAGTRDFASYLESPGAVFVDLQTTVNGPTVTSPRGFGADAEGDRYAGIEGVDGSAFNDVIRGGVADEFLIGRGGDDTLIGSAGADLLNGFNGVDTADYASSPAAVTIGLGTFDPQRGGHAEGDRLLNIDIVRGSAFADIIRGSTAGGETLDGRDGNDFLDSRGSIDGGIDRLEGGAGQDTYAFIEGLVYDGTRILDTSGTGDRVALFESELVGAERFGNDMVLFLIRPGTPRAAQITITDHFNGKPVEFLLDQETGAQVVLATRPLGGASAGLIAGTAGADTLDGRGGGDLLFGNGGRDRLLGGEGDDRLDGGAGDDVLLGQAGDDFLLGGDGNDRLEGDGGRDVFAYLVGEGAGSDVALDFVRGQDRLALAARGADGRVGAFTFADLDSDRDGVLDDGDALVSIKTVKVDGAAKLSTVIDTGGLAAEAHAAGLPDQLAVFGVTGLRAGDLAGADVWSS